jgi:hypothetical protein
MICPSCQGKIDYLRRIKVNENNNIRSGLDCPHCGAVLRMSDASRMSLGGNVSVLVILNFLVIYISEHYLGLSSGSYVFFGILAITIVLSMIGLALLVNSVKLESISQKNPPAKGFLTRWRSSRLSQKVAIVYLFSFYIIFTIAFIILMVG